MSLDILFTSFGIARLVQAFDFAFLVGQDPITLYMSENFGITNPMANSLVLWPAHVWGPTYTGMRAQWRRCAIQLLPPAKVETKNEAK